MTPVVIGSVAAKHWLPDFRTPKDFDIFSPEPLDGFESFWHPKLQEWFDDKTNKWRHYLPLSNTPLKVVNLHELYTIKVSHSYWELDNGSWDKHIADVITLKKAGAILYEELHKLLYKVWEDTHGKKRVNLAMAAGDFFDDAVPRIYDHDSIHKSVAYFERPLYEDFLKPGEEIDIDMSRVKEASFEVQLKLFREEIATTALERWIIPSNYDYSPGLAWKRAFRKTVTSLTKGWSAQFIVEHVEHFIKPHDYVSIHKNKSYKLVRLEK